MTVAVAGTWSASQVLPSSVTVNPPPGTISLPVSVANVAGDWMFAVIGWRNVPGYPQAAFTVADDAHNWWEPADAGFSASAGAGRTGCAIWMAPAASAATVVYVCPAAYTTAYAATVYDVSGLLPWLATSAASGFRNSAGSPLAVTLGAAAASAFTLAAGVSDATGTPPALGGGAGWSSTVTSSGSNGADTTEDIAVVSAWQVTAGATTATWTAASVNLSAVTAAAVVSAAAPARPSPHWPVTYLELAPGAGFHTPPDQMTWVAATSRYMNLGVTQGRQYELANLSAGEGTLLLDNPDEALLPPGAGQYAGITSGTPVRLRCAWTGGTWQVSFHGDGVTAAPYASTNQVFAVQPSQPYTASAWLACSAPWAAGVTVVLAWYDMSGVFISSASSAVSATGVVPVLALAAGTSPLAAASAAVIVQAAGTPPAATVFYASAAPPVP